MEQEYMQKAFAACLPSPATREIPSGGVLPKTHLSEIALVIPARYQSPSKSNGKRESMDARDRELLNEIQAGFPVESHPYRVIGHRLGMDQDEVLTRIEQLKKEGIIRRIGASINSRHLGFVSTLLAARVPLERFDSFVWTVNACPGVTHNYERKHEYNVWFTLIASSQAEKQRIIEELKEKTGVEIEEFPARRVFKIRVDFRF